MIRNIDRTIIKIICFAAAVISWLYVMNSMNPKVTKEIDNITLEIENQDKLLEKGYNLYDYDIDIISVKFSGLRNDVLKLQKQDIVAKIDISGYEEGNIKVPVEIILPKSFELIDYSPKQVLCSIDQIINKSFDLNVQVNGDAAQGMFLGEPEKNISSVIVTGPRTQVESIEKALVIFDVESIENMVTKNLPVNLFNKGNVQVDLPVKPSIASVTLPVYPEKTVVPLVQLNGTVENGYIITDIVINPENITIAGEQKIIDKINHAKTESIDISGKKDVFTQTVKIINEGYVSDTAEVKITVIIDKIIEREFEYNIEDIKFINLAKDYEVKKSSESSKILLKITGAKSKLDSITKDDISVEVDLKNTEKQKFIGEVKYTTNIAYEKIELNMDTVTVDLLKIKENN